LKDQDPAALGPKVVAAARETLRLRYSLLPYLYSLFYEAHLRGEPVARPMFYEFPTDPNTYQIQTTFMLGNSVLIIPVLEEGHSGSTLKAYLPQGLWYSHYDPGTLHSPGKMTHFRIPEEFHSIPVLYREGSIVVTQNPSSNAMAS